MAHVYLARNDLKTKLENSRHSDFAAGFLHRTAGTILAVILLAASLLAILFLATHTEIPLMVREAVPRLLLDAIKAALIYLATLVQQFDHAYGLLVAAGVVIFAFFWYLAGDFFGAGVYLCLTAVVGYLSYWALYSIVHVALYAIPALIGYWAALLLFDNLFGLRLPSGESAQTQILQSGVEGEQEALKLLKKLDNSCHIFANLRIPYDGDENETDFIIVCPAGVTIAEVKNYKGVIEGDASDEELTKSKAIRGGSSQKTFRNPIRQVGIHTYRLAGFLRNQGIHTHVRRCVLFVNRDATLAITDRSGITEEKCPVFTRDTLQEFYDYVSRGNAVLNPTYLQRTVDALNDLRLAGLSVRADQPRGN